MKTDRSLLRSAWKKLVLAYLLSFAISLIAGTLLVKIGQIQPQHIYDISTKRLAFALPVLEAGTRHGIDLGLMLFIWNSIGALATLSFIYTATWFDPQARHQRPRAMRKIFCGTSRMRLFCYLPGCAQIEAEPLRRLYVWVMVPLLGIVLLGIESGLTVSMASFLFGSFFSAIIALLPHGLVEIPVLALAGAVAYSAHLLVNQQVSSQSTRAIFQQIDTHRKALPVFKITVSVIGGLFLAGLVEAHVTQRILSSL